MVQVAIRKANYSNPDIDALLEPLGGMGRFVEKGDRVLLKINLLSARDPDTAVTTHPEIVRAIAAAVKEAGGRPYVGDSPSGTFSGRALMKVYERSGMKALAEELDIPLNDDTGTKKWDVPRGKRLKKAPFCNFIHDADKIIAIPKLKTHSFQFLTLACKIMYGAIPGLTKAKYHAQFPSRTAFADMLIDILTVVKPRLFIMDGIMGMQGQGPAGGDPVMLGLLFASSDPVAMDIAVCQSLGIEPVGIPILKRAKIRNWWPESIEYPISEPTDVLHKDFRLPNTADHLLTGRKPPKKSPVVTDRCIGCGDCEQICPKGAVNVEDGVASVTYSKCIRCFCCHEVCPENAIELGVLGKRGKN